jgi:hypothetical protein
LPPKYLPLTPRNESEENYEEEENLESEFEEEGHLQLFLYNPQVMDGNNPKPNQPYEPWLLLDSIFILGVLHDIPKHPEKFLPKFDPKRKESVEDHVKKLLLSIRIQNINHGYVLCRIFPHTFENKSTTWFYSLDEASITSWRIFETIFLNKFGEDKMSTTLVLDLSRIKMDTHKRVKYFNQRFLSLLKVFHKFSNTLKMSQLNFTLHPYPCLWSCLLKMQKKIPWKKPSKRPSR